MNDFIVIHKKLFVGYKWTNIAVHLEIHRNESKCPEVGKDSAGELKASVQLVQQFGERYSLLALNDRVNLVTLILLHLNFLTCHIKWLNKITSNFHLKFLFIL